MLRRPKAAGTLASTVRVSASATSLDLSHNPLTQQGAQPGGFQELLAAVSHAGLKALWLSAVQLAVSDVTALAAALDGNRGLPTPGRNKARNKAMLVARPMPPPISISVIIGVHGQNACTHFP